ncbi:hypothetical protein EYF80_031639 [Liparis tanakae]|uniref:Uncharacterized protein n=1 Tax=Liparis tanakae TaxID=230148 RepID=A0A4Z2GX62_9TELE|nr:hypothetical protein EYF80_031639 [Liparis tanakae]
MESSSRALDLSQCQSSDSHCEQRPCDCSTNQWWSAPLRATPTTGVMESKHSNNGLKSNGEVHHLLL